MISCRHITKIVAAVTAISVLLCLGAMAFSDELTEALGGVGVSEEYETELFDTSDVISIDILMDESDWQEMLDNAISETYYACDVVINGTTFYNVGIRPKGNTSLSSIVSDPDNDRYSFKLEFDKYVDGQTCWGLDKLILNNNFADATNMKEALVYDMFGYLGADASLYNYAEISVNGGYWGVYLALEAVEDSFLLRNYGVESGELYKPESMGVGGGQGGGERIEMPGNMPQGFGGGMPEDFDASALAEDFDPSSLPEDFAMGTPPENASGDAAPGETGAEADMSKSDFGGFGGKGGGMSGGGSDLNYTDDELDSYSTIWDGSVSSSSDADHRAVVTALRNISDGTELETYLDVDNVLKYMAVHSFVVNDDSLSGNMAHNYYLYEHDGQLNILPWDYNLSFGGMGQSGGAGGVINDPIDTPFSGTDFFDALLENEEYLERYHEYYRELVEGYVLGGGFEESYSRIRSQIDALVEQDPNAMYTYEEYEAAAEMLYETVLLRAESVSGQLDGTIPSTDEGQSADSSALIDSSAIDIKLMGSFAGGGGGDGEDRRSAAGGDTSETEGETAQSETRESAFTPRQGETSAAGRGGAADFQGQSAGMSNSAKQGAIWLAGSLALSAAALLLARLYRRKRT